MKYNFDELIPRENTSSVKYDLREFIFGKKDIVPMWVADMDFRTPDFIVDAIKKRAEHEIFGYSIREKPYFDAQVNWLKKRFNWNVENDWIIYAPGVVPAFTLGILAYSQPGDEIIVQPPVYFPFFNAIKDNGRQLIYNQLIQENNTYRFDFDDLRKKITPRTKMLILCSPHNPTGRVWTKKELEELASICAENDLLILSDEIHADLVLKPHKHIPTANLSEQIAERTITFMAPSKTFNMAGLATSSVIISNQKLRQQYQQMVNNIHIGGGNVFGNVAAQAAYEKGEEWLDQLMNYINGNYQLLVDFVHTNLPQIKVIDLEATYLVWLDFSSLQLSNEELKQFIIDKAGLGLNDGPIFGPGGEGYQRMNIACPRSIVTQALNQLKTAIDNL